MSIKYEWSNNVSQTFDKEELFKNAYKCTWKVSDNVNGSYKISIKTRDIKKAKYKDFNDKIEKIFMKSSKYQSDIDKIKSYYKAYITELCGKVYSCIIKKTTIPTDAIKFVGALSLANVKIISKKSMYQKNFGKKIEESPIEKDRIYSEMPTTKIIIENPLMLMGYYDSSSRTIYLCHDNIIEVSKELSLVVPEYTHDQWFDILWEIVFFHELGHTIFTCFDSGDKKTEEQRANFISSSATNGKYDEIINRLTKIQPQEYQDPILSFAFWTLNNVKNKGKSYNKLYSEYKKIVMQKIYMGERL